MNKLFFVLIALSMSICIHAQSGGARIYAGPTILTNNDPIVNPDGRAHTGYAFGVDGRLMSGGMSFIIGGRFASVSRLPIDGFKLSGHEGKLTFASIRGGLDFSIFSFTHNMRIRSKLIASFDLVSSASGGMEPPQGYKINDGWMSGVTGLGADIGPLIVDLEYSLGLLNGYFQQEDSKFNSWTFSVGVVF